MSVVIPGAAALVAGSFLVSFSYGLLLLVPLRILELGGTAADVGTVASAGAVTAIAVLIVLLQRATRAEPHRLVAVSMAGVAGAGGLFAIVDGLGPPMYLAGALLGTAWAVVYVTSPMAMSLRTDDRRRVVYFGYLTGAQQIGLGAGPIVGRILVGLDLPLAPVFAIAGACALAGACVTLLSMLDLDRFAAAPSGGSLSADLASILRSEARFPVLMVALMACLFTTMTAFQTAFAVENGLDYSLYFLAYSTAVVASRFGLAPLASRAISTSLLIATAASGLIVAMAGFTVTGGDSRLYVASAVLFGLSYGLALPAIQARAVNLTAAGQRPRVLLLIGLTFQAAILGFPIIVGAVVAAGGYPAAFAILVGIAILLTVIAWWRHLSVEGRSG